jgi:hypothetical protein
MHTLQVQARLQSALQQFLRSAAIGLLVAISAGSALAQSRNLAPGFTNLPANAKILVTPIDVELFSISAGGVSEPRADWTSAAQANMKKELGRLREKYRGESVELDEQTANCSRCMQL